MSNYRWTRRGWAAAAVLLAAWGVGAVTAQRAGAQRDDPPAPAPAAPAAADPPAAPAATAEPAKAMFAEPDEETLKTWRKHVEEWKAIDPREQADNSFCYVCHLNYETEKLTTIHEAEGVGCETCHGMSGQHSQDEDSITPPDVIFARSKVAAYCGQCHEKRDLLEGDESHEQFFDGKLEADKTCTSCHDMKHTLAVRTRRWNKDTRKLEWSDGVRMMKQREESGP
ncbi:MAG: cytochrome c3 family protein [Pirellulaceae bacterium]|jgi:hypothetical protein|nr:cytochrome c3 family protein [Pirellulaceae bacterium]